MNKQVSEILKKYLKGCKLMQISSLQNNQPKIVHCWFSYDKEFNFYYISPHNSEHSKNIIKNPKVAVSIVNSKMNKGVGQTVQGLMFAGVAEQVKGKELLKAYLNFLKRYPKVSEYIKLINKKVKISSTRIYKIVPKEGIWYDEINFEDYPRRKIKF